MRIGIIGGGLLGISLAYFLSEQGEQVEVFEASPNIGGLAGPSLLPDGTNVDRFYHAILSSDAHMLELCNTVGLTDDLKFKETKMGFYFDGKINSMNNIVEFFRFPPLNWIDRFRLGLTVLNAQIIRDWKNLEKISVEEWLTTWSGKNTYENIWRPLLKAKFDGNFRDLPATYIWSRLVRMKSTRGGAAQKELAGHLVGGYISLIDRLCEGFLEKGGKLHLERPIQEIMIQDGTAWGVRFEGAAQPFDIVISTLQTPIFVRLIPDAPTQYREMLENIKYLGIIVGLAVLDRSLSGYWTINITEEDVPFTGIIETTSYIDPKYVGGHHLVYLPKYTSPSSDWQKRTDEEIQEIWLEQLERMFPEFNRSWIRYFFIHRERYVEPLHLIGDDNSVPAITTPVKRLLLATTAQIYPMLTNGESVTIHAKRVAAECLRTLKLEV